MQQSSAIGMFFYEIPKSSIVDYMHLSIKTSPSAVPSADASCLLNSIYGDQEMNNPEGQRR